MMCWAPLSATQALLFDKQHPAHHNLNNQQLKPLEAYVSFCLAFQHIIT
jgi:hypothetical protein